ncbi:MAG: hypothetical protein PF486_15070, partial [Prolixibacteraceae bacterium]|nr:hypothetical protein [Prolixibacteraceae bacterium]
NKRLEKHNNHSYGNHRFTAKANDWVVFLIIEARDYPHAIIRIERKIKAMKNRKYIQNLKISRKLNGTKLTKPHSMIYSGIRL